MLYWIISSVSQSISWYLVLPDWLWVVSLKISHLWVLIASYLLKDYPMTWQKLCIKCNKLLNLNSSAITKSGSFRHFFPISPVDLLNCRDLQDSVGMGGSSRILVLLSWSHFITEDDVCCRWTCRLVVKTILLPPKQLCESAFYILRASYINISLSSILRLQKACMCLKMCGVVIMNIEFYHMFLWIY